MLLVGSTVMFSSALVQNSANTFDKNPASTITDKIDTHDVIAWTFILSCLGVAVYVLVMIFAEMSKLRLQDFNKQVLSNTNNWAFR